MVKKWGKKVDNCLCLLTNFTFSVQTIKFRYVFVTRKSQNTHKLSDCKTMSLHNHMMKKGEEKADNFLFADKISPLLYSPSNFDMISLNLRGSLLMSPSFSSAPKPRPRIDYLRSDFRTNVECKAFIRCAHLQSYDEDLDNLSAIFFGLQVAPNSCASRTANHVVFHRRLPHLSASCFCYFSVQQNHPKLLAKNSSRSSQNCKTHKSELTHHTSPTTQPLLTIISTHSN